MPYNNGLMLSALRVLVCLADRCEPNPIDVRRIREAAEQARDAPIQDVAKLVIEQEMEKRARRRAEVQRQWRN